MRQLLQAFLLCLTVSWAAAEKATVVRFETRAGSELQTGTIVFGKQSLKIRPSQASGQQPEIVFRGDRQLVWIINHQDKSYFQMDKRTMERMAQQFAGVYQQMESQLAQLPPEQRAEAEKMLKGKLLQAEPEHSTKDVRQTGQRRQIDGYPCIEYELLSDGQREAEIWVTRSVKVDVDQMLSVMEKMGKFYGQLTRSMSGGADQSVDLEFEALGKLDGFPILIRNLQDGEVAAETHIRDIREENLKGPFELPAGYQLQSLER